MDKLKEMLIAQARDKGICRDGFMTLEGCNDIAALVDYYTANPDWCLERDFPSLALLKENFSEIGNRGVFVGRTFHGEMFNDLQTYVFHKCKGTISVGLNVDKAIIPMLYLANGCRLRIMGVGDIKPKKRPEVPIYTFGKNDVSARNNRYVKFIHYKRELS